ncbi:MAG: succinate dehydrogenase flavoprotein subunit, partial [Proteobacteria bacterium]|nr:succinate dehydrogenase flavoprotein subunit [Pseudomonadota bacterium]
QDMEFMQFHPTGIAGFGMLITEAARGEGGYLLNSQGERFMERYAPNARDLASRDVVARAIEIEVREGRGCGPNKDCIHLKIDHLGAELIKSKLPGIRELSMRFAHVDPMLYAVGECACVSIHGANRLGGNSLLDIVVFGRAAGNHILDYLKENRYHRTLSESSIEPALQHLARWDTKGDGESADKLAEELRRTMEQHCGVFRTQEILDQGVAKVLKLRERLQNARLRDHSKVFNTARIEAFETENLMEVALATVVSAAARHESRGAHSRVDYPERDDLQWLKHTLYSRDAHRLDYKPVRMKPLTVDSFPPKKRVY